MSYLLDSASVPALFFAYNSTAQSGVTVGQSFNVDQVNGISLGASGGITLDRVSLMYGEVKTDGTVGELDKIMTAFENNDQAEGRGYQVATNKRDSYDCDDGNYTKRGAGNQRLMFEGTQISGTDFESGADQTRFFGVRLSS